MPRQTGEVYLMVELLVEVDNVRDKDGAKAKALKKISDLDLGRHNIEEHDLEVIEVVLVGESS